MIATDHAPHTKRKRKRKELKEHRSELLVLKQAFQLLYTNLVKKEFITLEQLIQFLTEKPADTFGLEAGRLERR